MKLKKIAAALLSGMLAFTVLAGCGSEDSSSKSDGGSDSGKADSSAENDASQESTGAADNESKGDESAVENTASVFENVKLLGRTYESEGTLWLGLSGTGVDFDFTGDSLKINMLGNPGGEDDQPRAALYVDGERKDDQMIASDGTSVFEVTGKGSEPVNVKVIKLSECAQSCMGITSIDAGGGTITPAADKPHRIEIIGDSITCGYGVDDEDKDHHFSTRTEDCTKSYSYKTAQLLDADYSLVSFSGYGIISGYSNDGKKVESQQVPKYYEKLGYTYNMGFGTEKPENLDWDFSKFQPEVVVVNLGTNDMTYAKTKETKQEYEDAYVEFLKTIRSKNPDAKIYCTLGIMGTALNNSMKRAVLAYTEATGDNNILPFDFPQQNMNEDGIAADWHPSDKTHTKNAELLSKKIKEDMGW